MRGKAVEKYGIGRGLGHEFGVDLVRRENRGARVGLALLAHAGSTDRCRSRLRSCDSFFRSAKQFDGALRCGGIETRRRDNRRIRFVAGRRRDPQTRADARSGNHQRMADIIAIFDVAALYPRAEPNFSSSVKKSHSVWQG